MKKRRDWKQKKIKELKMFDWGRRRREGGESRKQKECSSRLVRSSNCSSITMTLKQCLSKIQIHMIVSRVSRKKSEKHFPNSVRRNNTNVDIKLKANNPMSNQMMAQLHRSHHQITKKKYKKSTKRIKESVVIKNSKQEQCVIKLSE